MIQRIQTIYMLATSILASITAIMPLAYLSTSDGVLYDLYARGLYLADGAKIQGSIYMFILALTAAAFPLFTIFLFKNRMLQVRLCVIEAILLLGNYVLAGTYYFLCFRVFSNMNLEVVTYGVHAYVFSSLAAIIFCYLAVRAT